MIVSLNEIEGLVLKAARGAGLTWGLAEEASVAARWLAAADLDWEDDLAGLLAAHATLASPILHDGQIETANADARLSPLTMGALLSDLGEAVWREQLIVMGPVAYPLWLLPFVSRLIGIGKDTARVQWPGVVLDATSTAVLIVDGDVPALHTKSASSVTISKHDDADSLYAMLERATGARYGFTVDDEAWDRLRMLEARTFVPASDVSRLAGAGAGLSDND